MKIRVEFEGVVDAGLPSETSFDVEATVNFGRPAQVYGPSDRWAPPDPPEVTSMTASHVGDDLTPHLCQRVVDTLEEQAIVAAQNKVEVPV